MTQDIAEVLHIIHMKVIRHLDMWMSMVFDLREKNEWTASLFVSILCSNARRQPIIGNEK